MLTGVFERDRWKELEKLIESILKEEIIMIL